MEKTLKTRTLADMPVGTGGVIGQVGGEGELRLRLLDMGLIPGTRVKVAKTAPMGDPLVLELRGYTLALRLEEARRVTMKEAAV